MNFYKKYAKQKSNKNTCIKLDSCSSKNLKGDKYNMRRKNEKTLAVYFIPSD